MDIIYNEDKIQALADYLEIDPTEVKAEFPMNGEYVKCFRGEEVLHTSKGTYCVYTDEEVEERLIEIVNDSIASGADVFINDFSESIIYHDIYDTSDFCFYFDLDEHEEYDENAIWNILKATDTETFLSTVFNNDLIDVDKVVGVIEAGLLPFSEEYLLSCDTYYEVIKGKSGENYNVYFQNEECLEMSKNTDKVKQERE